MHTALGEYEKSIRNQGKDLEINHDIGEKFGEGACLANLGVVFFLRGEYGKSFSYQNKGLEIIKEVQASTSERVARHNLGVCHALQGHFLKAIGYSLDAIRIHEGLRYKNPFQMDTSFHWMIGLFLRPFTMC